MYSRLFFGDYEHCIKKRSHISLLLAFLFLFPPLHLFIIPFYFAQKNSFSKVFTADFKRVHLFLIIYVIIIILTINLVSGYLFADYALQSNVSMLSSSQEISLSQLASIIIIAPIIEEFYFRGLLFNYFEKTQSKTFVLLLTSLFFSIIHFNIPSAPTLFALGASLGLFKLITGSILLTIILHSIFNCFMLLIIL